MFEPEKALDLLKLHSDWLWSVDANGILTEWIGNNGASSAKSVAPWISYLRRDSDTRDGLIKLMTAIRPPAASREPSSSTSWRTSGSTASSRPTR